MHRVYKVKRVLKATFIGIAIVFIIWSFDLSSPSLMEKQNVDAISSAVISLGFGAVLCLILHDLKKT